MDKYKWWTLIMFLWVFLWLVGIGAMVVLWTNREIAISAGKALYHVACGVFQVSLLSFPFFYFFIHLGRKSECPSAKD